MGWLLFITFLFVVGLLALREWQGPNSYRRRSCTGRAWKRAFPQASNEQIRRFLICFADGMAFSRNSGLKFHPNDQIMVVYRSIYGGKTPRADAMECETFAENLRETFDLPLQDILAMWHDEITLGEIFTFVTQRRAQSPQGGGRGCKAAEAATTTH